MSAGFCSITDALAEAQFYVLRKINNKFEALRRLSELLEQLGDLKSLIPNISSLVPIVDIDLSTYVNLVSNCPFLGLPPVSETSINALRNRVLSAYNAYMADLLNHPWMRMGELQDQLTKYQQQVNAAFAEGAQYIQCLQAACQAARATGSFLERVSSTDIDNEFARFGTNFVQNGGQVLTATAELKYSQALQTVETLRDLGADARDDYSTAKRALTDTASGNIGSSGTATDVPVNSNPIITLPSP